MTDINGARTNQALFGFGDAVAVPAVNWLATHYLMPLVTGALDNPPPPGHGAAGRECLRPPLN